MKVNPTDDLGFSEKSHAKYHTTFSIAYMYSGLGNDDSGKNDGLK